MSTPSKRPYWLPQRSGSKLPQMMTESAISGMFQHRACGVKDDHRR
jgi:hypothetical protein